MTTQIQYASATLIFLISMVYYLSSLQPPHGISFLMSLTSMASTFFIATCSTLHFLRLITPMRGDFWISNKRVYEKVVAAVLVLTRGLKDSLPYSDRNKLSDPILCKGRITSLDIMEHIRTQYGTLTSNDYKLLYAQLTNKFDSPANFTGFSADRRFIFQQLASQGQPIPELQQCDY